MCYRLSPPPKHRGTDTHTGGRKNKHRGTDTQTGTYKQTQRDRHTHRGTHKQTQRAKTHTQVDIQSNTEEWTLLLEAMLGEKHLTGHKALNV